MAAEEFGWRGSIAATWQEIQRDYSERMAAGLVITPDEFIRRCLVLRKRGLRDDVGRDLFASGSVALLRQLEQASDADLLALNAAAA